MTMKTHHARRQRRTAKQTLKHGDAAKRKHARKGGRTGSIRAKKARGSAAAGPHLAVIIKPASLGKTEQPTVLVVQKAGPLPQRDFMNPIRKETDAAALTAAPPVHPRSGQLVRWTAARSA